MLYWGPLRVPEDAKPGKATVRVSLPDSSRWDSLPTDLPVTIE
jgi:hypothetical protein